MSIFNKEQRKLLKSFSKINDQVYFTSNTIGISSVDKQIILYWDWDETIPNDFGINNVNELLNIVDFYDTPKLNIKSNKIEISEGKSKAEYIFTAKENITRAPSKNVLMTQKITGYHDTITIPKDQILKIQKAINIFSSPYVVFEDKSITAVDEKMRSSSNKYSIDLDFSKTIPKMIYQSKIFNVLNEDDYTLKIAETMSGKNKMHFILFESSDKKVTYISVPLTESSVYN